MGTVLFLLAVAPDVVLRIGLLDKELGDLPLVVAELGVVVLRLFGTKAALAICFEALVGLK